MGEWYDTKGQLFWMSLEKVIHPTFEEPGPMMIISFRSHNGTANANITDYQDRKTTSISTLWQFRNSLTKTVDGRRQKVAEPNFWIVCRWEGGQWVQKSIVVTAGNDEKPLSRLGIQAGDTLIGVRRPYPLYVNSGPPILKEVAVE